MASAAPTPGSPTTEKVEVIKSNDSKDSDLSTPIKEILDSVPDQGTRRALSVLISRTTLGMGPDAETAKILAESEMHEEDCRLKAYKASLENRETQNQRDHEFRKKRLNHQTSLTLIVCVVAAAAMIMGLYFSATGNHELGNPVLAASLTVLSTLAGKVLSGTARDRD